MRVAVVFFLSLCFLLLRGYDHVYAGVRHHASCYLPAQNIEKIQQTRFVNTNQNLPIIKNNSFSEKKEDFISVEDEDDDVVFTRRYVLLAKYFITLTCASVLIHFYNYAKNRLPFCKHLSYISSYKYILQRVLRI